ncbi:GDSL esterase/lipase At2g19060 [Linum grandiflorum]
MTLTKLISSATTFVFCVLWMVAMKPPLQCLSQGDLSGPCAFFLGGDPFDVGTNNYLNRSTARADFPPNGVDYPAGPTGRFSNGRNMADYIGNESLYVSQLTLC